MGNRPVQADAVGWFSGELKDPELEAAFRDFDFKSVKRRVLGFAFITLASMSAYTVTEEFITGRGNVPGGIQETRVLVLAATVATVLFLARTKNRVVFERTSFAPTASASEPRRGTGRRSRHSWGGDPVWNSLTVSARNAPRSTTG